MENRYCLIIYLLCFSIVAKAQSYPPGYFRHPLNIPMQLVANFGEIRTNHWHMGLDIRTQQKENLPIYASAGGYISRVVVEPGGFGQAIYINHPNGYTTLYAHLNGFFPALAQYIKKEQYARQSWKIDMQLPANLFLVEKGEYIGLSGNTGGSAGPHVHFEIRDTKTDKVLNPLLFRFPIGDAVPPTLVRLAMYDRNRSTYMQPPQLLSIQSTRGRTIRVGSDKISFAIGAVDRLSGSSNPNGIYSARVSVDGKPVSEFVLNNIDYVETRSMNAQIDYPLAVRRSIHVQHISPLPGEAVVSYNIFNEDGVIHLDDLDPHRILIEVQDANRNTSRLEFAVQYDPALKLSSARSAAERLIPNQVNIFERDDFELFTTERSVYDTIDVTYSADAGETNAVSLRHNFLDASIPSHDSIGVKLRTTLNLTDAEKDRMVIKNISGTKTFVQKAVWQNGFVSAKFRQFGSYQAFVDKEPPTINWISTDLTRARSIVFTPRDNFNNIKSFRAELDGKWLRFSNDKGKTWVYSFDERFPRGAHQLKVIVQDEAGNVAEKIFQVRR